MTARVADRAELAEVLAVLMGWVSDPQRGWVEDALCAETDPEAFYPEKGGSVREAKRICQLCEVRTECLAEALENDERFGIWGGVSERERRKLKKVLGGGSAPVGRDASAA